MSASTASKASSSIDPGPAPAPWRSLFLEHLSKLDSPEFVLSTLSRAAAGAPTPFVPRARYCIYRGMLGEIPYSAHYDVATYGKNEAIYESDMLTFTTDARMDKTSHILMASSNRASPSSGGGGPVEAVFWIRDVMTQWRFKGEAYMIGPDIEQEDGTADSGTALPRENHVRSVKAKLMANMRRVAKVDQRSNKAWSWQQEWHSHFGNLSPIMRGSFQNAPPGKPVGKPLPLPMPMASAPPSARLGQKITSSLMAHENAIARRNFRVVVIRTTEVERLDLDTQRRWRWRRGRGNDRERESESEGGAVRETGSDRESDRERDREGERERETECDRETARETETESGTERDSEGNRACDSESEEKRENEQHENDAVSGVASAPAEGNMQLRQLGDGGDGDATASQWIVEELWP